jgi:hypothetical protein
MYMYFFLNNYIQLYLSNNWVISTIPNYECQNITDVYLYLLVYECIYTY